MEVKEEGIKLTAMEEIPNINVKGIYTIKAIYLAQ